MCLLWSGWSEGGECGQETLHDSSVLESPRAIDAQAVNEVVEKGPQECCY